MRILIVSPFFPPQDTVASLRVHSFASAWARRDEDVTVLTTAKRPDQQGLILSRDGFEVAEISYTAPGWMERLRAEHKSAGADPGSFRGRMLGVLSRLRARTGILGGSRMPDLTDHWVEPAVRWGAEHGPWDVAVSSSGPYTAHLAALELKRRGAAQRWVADFRDLWTDSHAWPGLFPFTLRERRLQRACLAAADRVWTVSDELAETLRSRTRAPVDVIHNGFDQAELDRLPSSPAFAESGLGPMVYTGTLNATRQDASPLLRAWAALRDRDPGVARTLSLVVVGDGYEHWRALAESLGLGSLVDAGPRVERSDALRMQRDAGALLLVDWTIPDSGVLTGKVFEYLAATAPILVVGGVDDAERSSVGRLVTRAGRGAHLGTDEARIADGLARFAADPGGLAGPPDRDFIAGFERDRLASRALDIIREAAQSN